jgi:hypothetical protein
MGETGTTEVVPRLWIKMSVPGQKATSHGDRRMSALQLKTDIRGFYECTSKLARTCTHKGTNVSFWISKRKSDGQ